MVDVNEELLNAASQRTYGLDYQGGLKRATGLDLDPNGICKAYFGKELNQCYTELLGDGTVGSAGLLSSHALLLPGYAATGSYVSTPDAVALDIVGDIDMRAEYASVRTENQLFFSKWITTTNQRSYQFGISPGFSIIAPEWSNNGIAELNGFKVDTDHLLNGARRVTIDVDNGAAQRVLTYYRGTTLENMIQWAQDTVAGATAIFAGTAQLTIGVEAGLANDWFGGRIYRVEIRNGINGTVVANPDFRSLAPGTTSFTDGAGRVWTLQGNARIV